VREPLNNFEFISKFKKGQRGLRTTLNRAVFWDVISEKNRKFPVNLNINNGEFDPGSERTLAAWIRHASRTRKFSSESEYSGERVSNGWKTCPSMGDNSSNELLIPHTTS
jgi:hypothetical protein